MTKRTGLGMNLYIDGHNVSGDVGELGSISTPRGVFNMTGIDKRAYERLLGLADGTIEATTFFNPTGVHPVLADLPRTDRLVTVTVGTEIGDAAASCIGKQIDYTGERGDDGEFKFETEVQASAGHFGLAWGELLTPGVRTDDADTDGDGLDNGAATALGLRAFLHVIDFTGTDATVLIEDSANGTDWAALADGEFAEITTAGGGQSETIVTAADATVRRHLRVITEGTFDEIVFAVAAARWVDIA